MELLLPRGVNVGCIRSAGRPGSLLFLSQQARDSVSLGLGRGVAQAQAGPFLSPGVDTVLSPGDQLSSLSGKGFLL